MPVDLTPKGTRGVTVPKIPRPIYNLILGLRTAIIKLRGGQILELTTVGAKSGQQHTVPLRWISDGENSWLIVASYGGATKHPAWYFNMAKNPDQIWVQIGKNKFKVQAESLKGAEREQAWKRIVAQAPGYGKYQIKTDREIPVVRLKAVSKGGVTQKG